MEPKSYFHLFGYTIAPLGFAMLYWSLRPGLVARGRDAHLKALLPIHFFRYFGLTAMLPGVSISRLPVSRRIICSRSWRATCWSRCSRWWHSR